MEPCQRWSSACQKSIIYTNVLGEPIRMPAPEEPNRARVSAPRAICCSDFLYPHLSSGEGGRWIFCTGLVIRFFLLPTPFVVFTPTVSYGLAIEMVTSILPISMIYLAQPSNSLHNNEQLISRTHHDNERYNHQGPITFPFLSALSLASSPSVLPRTDLLSSAGNADQSCLFV